MRKLENAHEIVCGGPEAMFVALRLAAPAWGFSTTTPRTYTPVRFHAVYKAGTSWVAR